MLHEIEHKDTHSVTIQAWQHTLGIFEQGKTDVGTHYICSDTVIAPVHILTAQTW